MKDKIVACCFIFLLTISYFLVIEFPTIVQAPVRFWIIETVDLPGNVGTSTSLALDNNDHAHIAYERFPDNHLKYAYWNGIDWDIQLVDSIENVGEYNSIVVDSNGHVHIAYFDESNGDLNYAKWNGSNWYIQVVDSEGYVGLTPSIKVDNNNYPHISYWDQTSSVVKYAKWNGMSWINETVDSMSMGVSFYTSLALDKNGSAHIGYSGGSLNNLKYAWWNGSGWNISTIDQACFWTSIALDNAEYPHIGYSELANHDLKYAWWNGSGWIVETVDSIGVVGYYVSLALDNNSYPHMSYLNGTNKDLKYASWNGTSWDIQTVDSVGDVGSHTSIVIDSDGHPHITYHDSTNSALKYAKGFYESPPPTSSVRSITPYWWITSPIILDADAQDINGTIVQVDLYYRFDVGSGWSSWIPFASDTSPPWQWSFPWPSGEGRYEFYCLAYNGQKWEVKVEKPETSAGYDVTPPASTTLQIVPYWHIVPSIDVNASASDSLSGVENVTLFYSYSVDNISWGVWIQYSTVLLPPWSWSFTFPDGEGHYRFHTIASDVAGNVEGNKTVEEAIAGYKTPLPDYTPINPLPVPPTTIGVSSSLQLSIDVQNIGGSANATASLAFYNESTPSTPFHILQVPPISAGDISSPFTATWTSHATPSTCNVTVFVDYYDNLTESNESNNVFTWTIDVLSGPVTKPDYIPVQPLPSSTVRMGLSSSISLSVQVLNQGNATAIEYATLAFYNETTPTMPFEKFTISPLDPSRNSPRFTAAWSSSIIPGTYRVMADVDYYNNVTEWDETNNVYTWTIEVVEGPVTSLVIGNPNYTTMTTYVKSFTSLDFFILDQSGMGIRYTTYRIDNTTWENYTLTGQFFLAGEGEHYVEWYSEDYAGNVENVTAMVLRIDDIPPTSTLSISNPNYLIGGNFVTSSTPLTLQAVDGGITPVGHDYIEYQIDGGGWNVYSSSFFLTGEGTHTVEYRSRDLLTNVETTNSIQLIVDDSPPTTTVSIGQPKHQDVKLYVSSNTEINLTSTDGGVTPVGLDVIEYRIDGGTWQQYISNFTLTGDDGNHTIEYNSTDLLGNIESVNTITLILDNTPPATTITPATGPYTLDTMFTLTANDSGCGVNVTRYSVDGGELITYSGGFTLTEGLHDITYFSIDNVGNEEAERSVQVNVRGEQLPPEVETNYKPLVALIFAIVLALVGLWSSKRKPILTEKSTRKRIILSWAILALPFIVVEAVTGMVSITFEPLKIPPLVGWGTGIDLLILIVGLLFLTLRLIMKKKVSEDDSKDIKANDGND